MPLRTARGRGNQGDWLSPKPVKVDIPQEIKDHNAAIEAKRKAKLAAKKKAS